MRIFVYEHVTAGGMDCDPPESLLREGRAMRDAVVEDFGRIPGVRADVLPDDRLHSACEANGTVVIAPEFDNRLYVCTSIVANGFGYLLGTPPEVLARLRYKSSVAWDWVVRGVRTPFPVEPDNVRRLPDPPWVCKPAQGAGSQATFLVRTREEWPAVFEAACAEWNPRNLIVQPFVPGVAASVAFLCGPGVTVPLLPTAQRLTDDGRFRYLGGRLPLPPELARRATRLATAAVKTFDGLRGYVGVDLVLGPNPDGWEDYAIELNPRLTTSYLGLRRLCEDNLAELWLRVLRGEAVEPRWKPGVVEFDADGTTRVVG